ncbi:MAG: hypothetical protein Q7S28_00105 [bacterium]|nr:hypothetical protein [bacterium]
MLTFVALLVIALALLDLRFKTVTTGVIKCIVFIGLALAALPIVALATFEAKQYHITLAYVVFIGTIALNFAVLRKRYKAKKTTPQ